MLRQIKLLLAIQLCNLCGINQVRYTKDKTQKNRFVLMAILWTIVTLMAAGYIGAFAFGIIWLGIPEVVPVYLFVMTSMIIFFFGFFKASAVIFQMNSYEMLVSFPVSETAIVVSRFLTMYVTNLLLSLVIMLPGLVVYGITEQRGMTFILYAVAGIIVLPFLPMTAATAVGAVITAISAKMKHKNLVAALLTIVFAVVLIAGSSLLSGVMADMDKNRVYDMVLQMKEKIYGIYPPAVWFGSAVTEGNVIKMLLLLAVSLGCFVTMVAILQKNFMPICMALHATSAKNNYQMKVVKMSSPLKALWSRELRRYFASTIYVSNTMIGYVMMVLTTITVFIMGVDKIEAVMGLPGVVGRILPVLIAWMAGIMPTTSCSISMEGKQWWLAKSLPITNRDLWNSKILVNLTIALPFYLVSVVFGILAVGGDVLNALCMLLIPACYILFISVLGITVNLAMPVMEWENEVRVVKQSTSTIVTMLLGFVFLVLPITLLLVIRDVPQIVICLPTVLILLALTAVLYNKNNQRRIAF